MSGAMLHVCASNGGIELRSASLAEPLWLPAEWVRDNAACHCDPGANQLTLKLEHLVATATPVKECSVDKEGAITAVLEDGTEYTIPAARLVRYGLRQPLGSLAPLTSTEKLQRIEFGEAVTPHAAGRRAMMQALLADGICIVRRCPDEDLSVLRLCRSLAPATGELKTLYGSSFKVDSAPREGFKDGPRSNLAYTGKFLDLHNDLPWYESMPGLQLLHCQRFDDDVKGGETYFVDAFGAAEELRRRDPAAFEALTQVPVVFTREDTNRAVAARYYAAVPYISLDHAGGIRKVVWSLQNEGAMPLSLGAETLGRFYAARKVFAQVLLEWRTEKLLKLRLQPGECVVWNQVRVLHGRFAFEEPKPGMRRLHGAYTNIDDWASEARQVLLHDGAETSASSPQSVAERFGNGSWM